MLNTKKIILFVIIIISLLVFTLNITSKNKYSRNKVIEFVAKSSIPNNIYIENIIYNNNINCGFAKFYIKDDIEYIYQENKKQEKIETYINNESNTSTTVLHSEKIIIQNNNVNNDFISTFPPLKDNLLDKLNNSTRYQYNYYGKEKLNEINCIKISLSNNENNEIYNYYIDEDTGYIVQYEDSENKETYKYNMNSVTTEQLKLFNVDNYSEYSYLYSN